LLVLELQLQKGGSLGSKFLTGLDSSIHTFFFQNVSSRTKHSINLDDSFNLFALKKCDIARSDITEATYNTLCHTSKK